MGATARGQGPDAPRGVRAHRAYLRQGPVPPAAAAAQEVGTRRSGSRQLTRPKIAQQRAPQLAASPGATPSPRHRHRHRHLAHASLSAGLAKSGLKSLRLSIPWEQSFKRKREIWVGFFSFFFFWIPLLFPARPTFFFSLFFHEAPLFVPSFDSIGEECC